MSAASNPVLFVGAGPGDPELITVKGQKALKEAGLVIYAGSLVPKELLVWTRPDCEAVSSASMHLDEFVGMMISAHKKGKRVVRLHTGDPALYGAIAEQIAVLKEKGIPFQVIPGVTAAFAASAAMGIEYTLPEITQTLILTRMAGRTPVPDAEALEKLASHRASMSIYLSIGMVEKAAEILARHYGADGPAAVAYKVSQPDQQIFHSTIQELPQVVKRENICKTALIIVGDALDSGRQAEAEKSKLYDRKFAHEYRRAE